MYSDTDLEGAVAAGALSAEDVQKFRDHIARSRASPVVDEEHFRLLTGFNDIFVGMATIILLVAVAWIGRAIAPGSLEQRPVPGVLFAATAWGLAEFFTRKRRMALPSIILLLAFVGGVLAASVYIVTAALGPNQPGNDVREALKMALAAALAAGAAWIHWQRFRVPITVAAGSAAAAGLVVALVASIVSGIDGEGRIILGATLALGLCVFLFAMWWDSSDPQRQTRNSDVAFWLHLLAAPMIVHPVFVLLGLTGGDATAAEGMLVLLVYVGLGVAALAIDRRALLVSALVYVLYALNDLFETYGVVELSVALTALVIGSALLLLSAFWQPARRAVVGALPPALQARLPVLDRQSPA